jgi:phosphoribosyl-dephospho-CoA transferase
MERIKNDKVTRWRGDKVTKGTSNPVTLSPPHLVTLPPCHDLLRLREPIALMADAPVPPWVEPGLRRTPWVVVRRGHIQAGRIPVGVRGMTRSQRFAAWLAVADIAERRSPEELWDDVENRPTPGLAYAPGLARTQAVPALAALARIAPLLARHGYRWGPGGSVGFELATAVATVTASSDLDVILRQARRLEPDEVRALQAALLQAATPARIDVLLETPRGGVSLADLAAAPTQVLVRTPDGTRLMADPWTMDADAATERAS